LFTRGETQALVTATLGTKQDAQHIEGLGDEFDKTFMLHYNFPPFSTGETKPLRGASRRETGHGHWPSWPCRWCCPTRKIFPTQSAWCPRSSNQRQLVDASVCGGALR